MKLLITGFIYLIIFFSCRATTILLSVPKDYSGTFYDCQDLTSNQWDFCNFTDTNSLEMTDTFTNDFFKFKIKSFKISLAWDASVDQSVTGYKIYCDDGESWDVGNVTNVTIAVTNFSNTNSFWATAYDMTDDESVPSNIVEESCILKIKKISP